MFIGDNNAAHEKPRARIVLDASLNITAAEAEVEAGVSLAPLELNRNIADYVHDSDIGGLSHNCEWVRDNPDNTVTLRIRFLKASNWWVEADAKITAGPDGAITLTVNEDSDANARATVRKLRDIVDGARNGAAVIDGAEPVFVNAGLAHLLGYDSLEEFIGSGKVSMVDNIHRKDLPIVAQRLADRKAGKEVSPSYEVRFIRKDGSKVWVEITGNMAKWDGRIVSVSWITDITERKQAEQSLIEARKAAEAANESKSAFLASMSHEIRTPLNGVLGMAQALAAEDLTPDHRAMVDTITDSGKSLMAILNDVLDISKIEAGKLQISPVPGDLRHSIKRVRNLFEPTATDKNLKLELTFDSELPGSVTFDPVRVRQCVSNLVSNALKFTSQGEIGIHVGWSETDGDSAMATITVTDTGIGISEEALGRLFTAFEQADNSTTRKFGGTGLGLAISRKLANMMGGDLNAASKLGEGSTFTLTFAVSEFERIAPSPTAKTAATPSKPVDRLAYFGGKRLLLVDDNAVNRQVARLLLAPLGLEITDAANGREALDALSNASFDVVLLDIHMPVMDGPTAIRAIRESGRDWSNLPVIALTADAMQGDAERYLAMGMNDYVSKPINARDLEHALTRAISGAGGASVPEAKSA